MPVYLTHAYSFGDIISWYLDDGPVKHFKFLKEHGFNQEIIMFDNSTNRQSMTLHELNPYYKAKFVGDNKNFNKWLQKVRPVKIDSLFDWNKVPAEKPLFYLTDEEQKFVDSIPKPYFALHPYASSPDRSLAGIISVKELVSKLASIMPVVLLGGSWFKIDLRRKMSERCSIQHSDVYNIVDVWNGRTQCEIVKQASLFGGSISCYANAALYSNVKSICITSDTFYEWLNGVLSPPTVDVNQVVYHRYHQRLIEEAHIIKWNQDDLIDIILEKVRSFL